MRGSSNTAHTVTGLLGLVAAPVGVFILSLGGDLWMRARYTGALFTGDLAAIGPALALSVVGLALLVGVVITALWSPAGLLAAGAVSLIPIAVSAYPELIMELLRLRLPHEAINGIAYGLPLTILPLLGFLGIALVLMRRPGRLGSAVLAAVVSFIALTASGALLMWGVGQGQLVAIRRFLFGLDLLVVGAILLGIALLGIGVLAVAWARWALIAPAVGLFTLTVIGVAGNALLGLPRELSYPLMPFVSMGGAIAVAVVMVAFTVILPIIRRRAGRDALFDSPEYLYAEPGAVPGVVPGAAPAPGQAPASAEPYAGGPVPSAPAAPPPPTTPPAPPQP